MILAKVRFGAGYRFCSVSLGAVRLERGERILVRTEDSLELGEIMDIFPGMDHSRLPADYPKLERLPTPEDLAQEEKNRLLEERAFHYCQERIEARQLPIYLVRVEVLFDASKIIFFFTAPGRVDFRELVKDLVQEFRCRIELRQIGVRHRAKMVGGLGICGRTLCCAGFLKDFEPVSVRMAKEQQLSLNPGKISGVCGRLMCCLTYEYSTYQDIRRQFPKVGKTLKLPEGEAKIVRYNLIRQTVTVELEGGAEQEILLADLPLSPLGTGPEPG
jgi:cell fate regulator YaaT (PSP1 superfamily)